MPLLYGEGDKAFYRLQLELIQRSNEHTIFAWNPTNDYFDIDIRLSLLASHPLAFQYSSGIEVRDRGDISTFEMTNSGLRITLRAHDWQDGDFVGILNCQDTFGHLVGVNLRCASESSFTGQCFRRPYMDLAYLPPERVNEAQLGQLSFLVPAQTATPPRRLSHTPKNICMRVTFPNKSPNNFRLQKIELQPNPWKQYLRDSLLFDSQDTIELPHGLSGGFLFSNGISSYMVALGPHRKTMWSAVIPEVQLASASASRIVDEISDRIMEGCDLGYLGDHRSHVLREPVATKVTVRAKKRRIIKELPTSDYFVNRSSTVWDITITFHSLDEPALPSSERVRSIHET
jgi:hypothetical protein